MHGHFKAGANDEAANEGGLSRTQFDQSLRCNGFAPKQREEAAEGHHEAGEASTNDGAGDGDSRADFGISLKGRRPLWAVRITN